MWWAIIFGVLLFLRTVVDTHYCGVVFFVYCGGYEIIAKVYRSSEKNHNSEVSLGWHILRCGSIRNAPWHAHVYVLIL